MVSLIDSAINRSRTILSVLVLILIAGTYAYVAIPKESQPDVNIPYIYVSMSLEGISPADSERLLLRPLEHKLSTVEGIQEMTASAYQGGGFVFIEFQAGLDKDKAIADVRASVDQARPELPEDVEEPLVKEVDMSFFPVLVVTLAGDVPERTLRRLAENLQDDLEAIPSVLEAGITGSREEQVEILVNPEILESYGVEGLQVLNIFNRSNALVAAGNLDTGVGRFAIEVPGLFETVKDLMGMPVKTNWDSAITLESVSEIHRTYKDPETFARLNGRPAIAIEIKKRGGENIIQTIKAVKETVRQHQARWPESLEVTFSQDQSKRIQTMLTDLENNMISAVILVMIIILAALGARAAGLVGISIPGSFLAGILFLFMSGMTINVIVLFSLILSVGMLVDGAIVVTEYADRKIAEGVDRKIAYSLAARRMAWPIIASTATTLAAFAPLLFWPGMVGEFMKFMPLTMIAVLISSLAMALIFVPTLGAMIGSKKPPLHATTENDLTGKITGWYASLLEKALSHAGKVLLGALALLILAQLAYGKFGRGVEFFPNIEPDAATVLIHARGNLSIHEKDLLIQEIEHKIMDVEGLRTLYTRVGGDPVNNYGIAEDVIGQIHLEFTAWGTRPSVDSILSEIKTRTANIAGLLIETEKQKDGPPTGKAVQVQLSSSFPELLPDATKIVRGALEEIGGFIDIEDTGALPGIQWELEVDRAQAAKFGLDVTTIGQYIRMVTNGLKVADYRPDDSNEEIDIVLRHTGDRRTLDQLDRVRIQTDFGSIPVGNFVTRSPQPAVGTLQRTDQKRSIMVKADLPPGVNTNLMVTKLKDWIATHADQFDPRIEIAFRGEDEKQKEAADFLVKAFFVALFMMAIILVTQFNSFYQAFLILSAVIMSTIGVMLGLLITGQPFGIIMSGIGVIALAGIIVNNNIVLIDTFDQYRHEFKGKMSTREMILQTGKERLRPVLLTTITTILGLMPMVLQINIDFVGRTVSHGAPSTQWWVQLSTAIAFGLTFSTILTLIVTPCALMFQDRAVRFFKTLFDRLPLPRRLKKQSHDSSSAAP